MRKLSLEQVSYCREWYPKKSIIQLSKEFNVNRETIYCAIRGKTWEKLPGKKGLLKSNKGKSKLKEDQVREIRLKYPKQTIAQLSNEYGVSNHTIRSIIDRVNWKFI